MDETIDYGGTLMSSVAPELATHAVNGLDYAYQRIHFSEGEALFLNEHLQILKHTCRAIYGLSLRMEVDSLRERIGRLMQRNGYVRGSQAVLLKVFPEGMAGEGCAVSMLEVERTLLYPRFVVWHTRPMVEVVQYGHTDEGFASSVSLAVTSRARLCARRLGADEAIIENDHGVLVSIDDEPLFVVRNTMLYTSPLAAGATDSVMRRVAMATAQHAGIDLRQEPIRRADLATADEAFTLSVQGIVSFMGCGNQRFFNMTALRLAEAINRTKL